MYKCVLWVENITSYITHSDFVESKINRNIWKIALKKKRCPWGCPQYNQATIFTHKIMLYDFQHGAYISSPQTV